MNSLFSIILFLSSIIFSLGIYSCGSSSAHEENSAKSPVAAGIIAIHPTREKLSSSIQIPGELQAFQQVDLYAKVSSFVSKLHVDVGSEVAEGELLASLEAPELSAQQHAASSRLQSQEALYIASKTAYERLLQTSKTPGTVSANDLEQAYARQQSNLAQLEAARAAYKEVSDTRNYLQIRAPFSGVITARNVSAGAYVGPSGKGSEMPIFSLADQKNLRLVVSVPESYTGRLDKTGEVKFTVQSLPGDTFKAKISRTSGALDNKLRSQRVETDVQNNNLKLLPGMVTKITLPLQSSGNTLTVPASAVLNSTLGIFVIRVKNNKAEWVPVSTGSSNGNRTEVIGSLTEQDVLLKNASEEVRNGQEIKVNME